MVVKLLILKSSIATITIQMQLINMFEILLNGHMKSLVNNVVVLFGQLLYIVAMIFMIL